MAEYHANILGPNGHIQSSHTFVCDVDENAIFWVSQMMNRHEAAELWNGLRLVKRMPCSDVGQAIIHEVDKGSFISKAKGKAA